MFVCLCLCRKSRGHRQLTRHSFRQVNPVINLHRFHLKHQQRWHQHSLHPHNHHRFHRVNFLRCLLRNFQRVDQVVNLHLFHHHDLPGMILSLTHSHSTLFFLTKNDPFLNNNIFIIVHLNALIRLFSLR